MRRGRPPTRHSGAAFQGHEINPSALHAGLELCAPTDGAVWRPAASASSGRWSNRPRS